MISLQFIESALIVWRQEYSDGNKKIKGSVCNWMGRKEFGASLRRRKKKDDRKFACSGFKEKPTKVLTREISTYFLLLSWKTSNRNIPNNLQEFSDCCIKKYKILFSFLAWFMCFVWKIISHFGVNRFYFQKEWYENVAILYAMASLVTSCHGQSCI